MALTKDNLVKLLDWLENFDIYEKIPLNLENTVFLLLTFILLSFENNDQTQFDAAFWLMGNFVYLWENTFNFEYTVFQFQVQMINIL